jgi:uncharacterized RDD family membrane protein YckC
MEPTPSEMPSGSPGAPQPPQAPSLPPQAPPPAAPPPQAPPAAAQPAWMQSLTSTAPVAGPAGLFYADIPNRAIAYIIDAVILFVGFIIVAAVLGAVGLHTTSINLNPSSLADLVTFNVVAAVIYAVVNTAISVAYFVYTWTAMRGTVGMKVLGMQIGSEKDGATLTMDQALRRALVLFGPGAIAQALGGWPGLGIIFSLVAFGWFIYLLYTTAVSPTKQGFHDKFVGSMVVKAARSVG